MNLSPEQINEKIGEVMKTFSLRRVNWIETLAIKFRCSPSFTRYYVDTNFNRVFNDDPNKQLAKWYLEYCIYD